MGSMTRKLTLVLGLVLLCNVAFGQTVKDNFPNAVEFYYSELDIKKGVVKSIEFDKYKCNLTLKNTYDSKKDVDLLILVLNDDGVILWHETEYWLVSSIEPGQKFVKDWDFKPALPVALEFSKYSKMDLTPTWVVVLSKPSQEIKNKFNPLMRN